MHELAARLLQTIRKQGLIRAGDRVAVAVSGGVDSVALLLLLMELRSEVGILLSIAHVNHKLRGEESDDDERFVTELARQHGLELYRCTAALDPADPGIEAAARELRYDFFRQLAREHRVAKIATAHTLDDQAETVLLRILRGSGIRGLAGIHPRLTLSQFDLAETRQPRVVPPRAEFPQVELPQATEPKATDDKHRRPGGEVIRPLLAFRRAELQEFLREQDQVWREDSTNRDPRFLRNRIRHRLIPVIAEEFGDDAIEHLADLAQIARAEEDHWSLVHPEIHAHTGSPPNASSRDVSSPDPSTDSVAIAALLALPLADQRRLIRGWLEANRAPGLSFRMVEEILDLAQAAAGRTLELPAGYVVRRTRSHLSIAPPGKQTRESEYEYALPVPGAVEVRELGIRLEATTLDLRSIDLKKIDLKEIDPKTADANHAHEIDRDRLLDPGRLPPLLTVRAWRPGDRFWPAHTKAARKVKELLSDRHIVGPAKKLWPVVVAGVDLVWVRGFPTPADLQPAPTAAKALSIQVKAGRLQKAEVRLQK